MRLLKIELIEFNEEDKNIYSVSKAINPETVNIYHIDILPLIVNDLERELEKKKN